MTSASIARLREGGHVSGRTWALGALASDDAALERFSAVLLERWTTGDRLVVLGNMLGEAGSPTRTLDRLLWLRRKLLARPGAEVEDFVFLRGALEEMWHKALQLQFAMSPLDVLDWMLARGLAATIEAYGHSVAEGRVASRNGPLAIARWTAGLRERQALQPGHADLMNSLARAALGADGAVVFAAAGVDPTRPLAEQADAFWWGNQSDETLDENLGQAIDGGWLTVRRVVRGSGPSGNTALADARVLTVSAGTPGLVLLGDDGSLVERIGL
jgi:serine/threonine protein phosphatase 1